MNSMRGPERVKGMTNSTRVPLGPEKCLRAKEKRALV